MIFAAHLIAFLRYLLRHGTSRFGLPYLYDFRLIATALHGSSCAFIPSSRWQRSLLGHGIR
jgi:hypothetical protein